LPVGSPLYFLLIAIPLLKQLCNCKNKSGAGAPDEALTRA
jgi:hypothetical protein